MVLSMERWKGKVAIVTGANRGIGEAITKKLAQEGLKVVGFDLRIEQIEELRKKFQENLYAVKADITKPEEMSRAFKWVTDNVGPVHILVNNAGILQQNTLVDGDIEKWKVILDTNVLGLCIATKEAIKVMKANDIEGHIIHINSVAGHTVHNVPNLSVYPASKHAVTALTETLRQELNRLQLKIKISSISPGTVNTELFQKVNINLELPTNWPMLKTEDLADCVLFVLSTPPHVQVHELIVKPAGEMV